jgi:hypothetical protein
MKNTINDSITFSLLSNYVHCLFGNRINRINFHPDGGKLGEPQFCESDVLLNVQTRTKPSVPYTLDFCEQGPRPLHFGAIAMLFLFGS